MPKRLIAGVANHWDLALVLGLAVATMAAAGTLSDPLAQTAMGMFAVAVLPGYTLMAALYAAPGEISATERLSGAVGLGVILGGLLALLAALTIGFEVGAFRLALLAWLTGTSAVAVLRRRGRGIWSADGAARVATAWRKSSSTSRGARLSWIAMLEVAVLALVLVAGAQLLRASAESSARFMEFYVVGSDGRAWRYPDHIAEGDRVQVLTGVVNHEGTAGTYEVLTSVDGDAPVVRGIIALSAGGSWEIVVDVPVGPGSGLRQVRLMLRKSGEQETLRTLHLWVDSGMQSP